MGSSFDSEVDFEQLNLWGFVFLICKGEDGII